MDLSFCFILSLFLASTYAADWSYKGDKGPDNWGKDSPACNGQSQSPVNILTSAVVQDTSLGAIKFSSAYSTPPSGKWTITNNGHSVTIGTATGNFEITDGGFGATYKLAQFHFHWGKANWQGSEHTVDGKKYPMEIHFVHYNTKYADLGAAVDKSDGLAVLGFFFDLGSENTALAPVVSKLTDVVTAKTEVDINPMDLMDLMGGASSDLASFYRYAGSLTTPGCYESVTWTVFDKILTVSQEQLTKFRSLKDGNADPMVDNFRPTLPLFSRKVSSSKAMGSGAASRSLAGALIVTTLTIALAKVFS